MVDQDHRGIIMKPKDNIQQIKELLAGGSTMQEVGDIYGVTRARIQQLFPANRTKCATCDRRVASPTKSAGLCSRCLIIVNKMPFQGNCFCGKKAVSKGMCRSHYLRALYAFNINGHRDRVREAQMGRPIGVPNKNATDMATAMTKQIADLEISIACLFEHGNITSEQLDTIKKFLRTNRERTFRNLKQRNLDINLTNATQD